ncbi:MAG TPA: hypothetical protein VKB19_00265 [Pedobacter sp.]|nr:hypothetical protein [Pedobacter sp.]
MEFEFVSVGPKGMIKKQVRYSPHNLDGVTYYNLAFGDLDPDTGEIDDLSVSDNKDRLKVLATVAATIVEFTNHFPHALVMAQGSTASRTRLYQMALSANLNEIIKSLHVFGLLNGEWFDFETNTNYEAFMVVHRN